MKNFARLCGGILCCCMLFAACGNNQVQPEISHQPDVSGSGIEKGSETQMDESTQTSSSQPKPALWHLFYPLEERETVEADDTKPILEREDNKTKLKNLLNKEYPKEILKDWFSVFAVPGDNNIYLRPSMAKIDERYPIPFLRAVEVPASAQKLEPPVDNQNTYYTVYKIEGGGLLFAFFMKTEAGTGLLNCVAYCEKQLRKKDFDSIQVGDSVDKVIDINPAEKARKEIVEEQQDTGFDSLHLLKDGAIYIQYYKNASGKYCIKAQHDMQYSESSVIRRIGDYCVKVSDADYTCIGKL